MNDPLTNPCILFAGGPANFRNPQTSRKLISLIHKDLMRPGSLHADVCSKLPQSCKSTNESVGYVALQVCMRTPSYYVGEGAYAPSHLRGGRLGLDGVLEVGR